MTTEPLDIPVESKIQLTWRQRIIEPLLFWPVVLACAATGQAILAPRLHWRFDLLTSFHHIYALALAVMLIQTAIQRPRKKALVIAAATGLIVNATIVAPLYWGGGEAPADAPAMRVAFLNVLRSNHSDERVVAWLRAADPDVIIVNELTSHHDVLLRREFPAYIHGITEPDEGYYGIGMFSRVPLERARVEFYGEEGEATVVAEAKIGGEPLMLVSTHLYPPFRADLAAGRNRQAAELAPFLMRQPRPLLFTGDLNMTSWSPYFRDLLRSANLRDGRRGFGLCATWPAALRGIGITIDHALCSDGVAIKSYKVGPNIGSDHRPFVVEVVLNDRS